MSNEKIYKVIEVDEAVTDKKAADDLSVARNNVEAEMKKVREKNIKDFREFMQNRVNNSIVLSNFLDELGYFTAPASVSHHSNYIGGLYDHSKRVAIELQYLTVKLNLRWDHSSSPFTVGMLHDLCKCDDYVMDDNGVWIYNKNKLLPGHGDKSVMLAQQVMTPVQGGITDEEMYCIRWHMGAFDDAANWSCYTAAVRAYPNVLYTHTADMIASQIIEIKGERGASI